MINFSSTRECDSNTSNTAEASCRAQQERHISSTLSSVLFHSNALPVLALTLNGTSTVVLSKTSSMRHPLHNSKNRTLSTASVFRVYGVRIIYGILVNDGGIEVPSLLSGSGAAITGQTPDALLFSNKHNNDSPSLSCVGPLESIGGSISWCAVITALSLTTVIKGQVTPRTL